MGDNETASGTFAGIPTQPAPVAVSTTSTTPCNGGTFPQYNADCAVGYIDANHVHHNGYPPNYSPVIVAAVPSLDGIHWGVFEWAYLDHIPAGAYADSFRFRPFTGPNPIETRALCGLDFGGKTVHRVPGIKEVNAVYFYRKGATPVTNPGYENGFNKAYLSTHQYAHLAMNSFMAAHPIDGMHSLPF